MDQLNLEGAARHQDRVRWFQRGNLAVGIPSASVDLSLEALVDAVLGRTAAADVPVGRPLRYDLGEVEGVGLAVTDAVALPDGRLLLSAAAEDTPNAVDDGPVVATALALVDDDDRRRRRAAPRGRRSRAQGRGAGAPRRSTAARCTCWPSWTTTTPTSPRPSCTSGSNSAERAQ